MNRVVVQVFVAQHAHLVTDHEQIVLEGQASEAFQLLRQHRNGYHRQKKYGSGEKEDDQKATREGRRKGRKERKKRSRHRTPLQSIAGPELYM